MSKVKPLKLKKKKPPNPTVIKEPPKLTAAEEALKEARKKKKIDHVKSHKERVENFNEKLRSMPEHFDIPRVGPG